MLTAFGIRQDQDITFEQFLKIMSWATTSTLDNKIRGKLKIVNSTILNARLNRMLLNRSVGCLKIQTYCE